MHFWVIFKSNFHHEFENNIDGDVFLLNNSWDSFLVRIVLTRELFKAWSFCSQHPYVYCVLVFEAMATFISQVFVLSLIVIFGIATIAMTTTARKAVNMIFTKPLTERHGSRLLLISIGIILKMLPDTKPSPRVQG
ncbi:hypothetical protein Gogos_019378 [Gossypium gossypioides]|uniref:Uncharacterized protein n=1 Tax=Gossypium gossypioides TaxID=34282 RepID=A0A7J9BHB7_GOSGO|nr:hypothetical protein [Gossypium gossypioides]